MGPEYTGQFVPTRPAEECVRIVVVDFGRTPVEMQQGDPAKGIITSYAGLKEDGVKIVPLP